MPGALIGSVRDLGLFKLIPPPFEVTELVDSMTVNTQKPSCLPLRMPRYDTLPQNALLALRAQMAPLQTTRSSSTSMRSSSPAHRPGLGIRTWYLFLV